MVQHEPGAREMLGKAGVAYEYLKDDLINGRLRPGRRIAPQDFTHRYSMSETPLRDAMLLLANEGFIAREPSHGFHVKDITVAEQRDLLWIGFVYLDACIREVDAPADALAPALTDVEPEGATADDTGRNLAGRVAAVHNGLAAASGNEILVRLSRIVVERTHLVRAIDLSAAEPAREAAEALKAFKEALIRRDRDQAGTIARRVLDARLARLPDAVAEAQARASRVR